MTLIIKIELPQCVDVGMLQIYLYGLCFDTVLSCLQLARWHLFGANKPQHFLSVILLAIVM